MNAVQSPDYMTAVYDFIAENCLPAMNPDHIIRGDQNRISLPKNSNNFAVFNDLTDSRIGSNVESFEFDPETEEDGTLTIERLGHVAVQIDFYGDEAKRRAMAVSILASSEAGVKFFNRYKLSVLFADDPRDATIEDGSDEFVTRWITTLHLSVLSGISQNVGWFDDATINTEVLT